jgi:hypothetical protein
MITIRVDTAAVRRILAALASLDSEALRREIGDAVGRRAVIPTAQHYPSPSGKPQPFVSAKQRRAFFAKLRSGEISVPYSRTGTLRAGWQQQGPFEVVNAVRYADLVQGAGRQAAYHAGTWDTETEIAQESERKAVGVAEQAVMQHLRRYL